MLDLRNFFKNHFDTREISDNNLHKFAEDHLSRLTAASATGKYQTLIVQTKQLHEAFFTNIKLEDQAFSQQQGKTRNTDEILAEFRAEISRREGAVRAEFGKDSAQYLEFFPQGLNEYHQINKANAELLMERVTVAAHAYSLQLGSRMGNTFEALLDSYRQARREQLERMGTVDTLKSEASNAREALTQQLMRNLLTLAAEYVGTPERLGDFFSQEMIRRNASREDGTTQHSIEAGESHQADLQVVSDESEIAFENTGAVPLRIGRGFVAGILPDQAGVVVQPGRKIVVSGAVLGTGRCLNVANETQSPGEYWILVL